MKKKRRKKKIKAIIFDLGGVVVSPKVKIIPRLMASYLKINYSQYENFLKKYNSSITTGKISLKNFYAKVVKHFHLKNITAEKILRRHLKIFKKIIEKLNQPLVSLVKKLRKNYLVFCLVNAEPEVVPLVKKRGVYDLFSRAFISTKLKMKKPDKKIYLKVLKEIKCRPEEVIFIDDQKENVVSAKKLGIKSIWYKNPQKLKKELENYLSFFQK